MSSAEASLDQLTALFELAQKRLSQLQFDIFSNLKFDGSANELVHAIVAAAGSGKTRLLSFLVGRALLDSSVNDVYLLTTTKAAKTEAYERCGNLQVELGKHMATRVLRSSNVRTIHSIARFWAIRKFEDRAIEIAPRGAVLSMIGDLLTQEMIKADSGVTQANAPDTTAIEAASNDIVSKMDYGAVVELLYEIRAERLKAMKPVVDDSLGPMAKNVLHELEKAMLGDDHGAIVLDFDSLVGLLALSGEAILHPGSVLFIDEFQDLSYAQLTIVMNSLKQGVRVVALGDSRQGIFGFSGALPQTFGSLYSMCHTAGVGVRKFELFQNHRSPDAIVRASEAFLGVNDRAGNERITGNGKPSVPVKLALCHNEPDLVAKTIVNLIKTRKCVPGDIVVLRHKNFGPKDEFVLKLNQEAKKVGVQVDNAVFGFDPANSLSVRVAAVLRVMFVEHFVDTPDEAIHHIKAFFKALRGVSVDLTLAMKTIDHVWNKMKCTPWDLFVRHNSKLQDAFVTFLNEAEEAEEKKAASKALQMPLRPTKRKRKTGEQSIKFANFRNAVHKVACTMQHLKKRLCDVFNGTLPLSRLSADGCPIPKQRTPRFKTAMGGLVWLIVSDLVNYKFHSSNHEGDDSEIENLISRYEQSGFEDFDCDFTDFVVSKTSALIAEKMDLDTRSKVVFSTIHKFKGLERNVVFSVNVSEPWHKPSWAQRATLYDLHDKSCTNKSGQMEECRCRGYLAGVTEMAEAGKDEKLRLMYVAKSRAREDLYISATHGTNLPEAFTRMAPRAKFNVNSWQHSA